MDSGGIDSRGERRFFVLTALLLGAVLVLAAVSVVGSVLVLVLGPG